jgi:hypothetical protein
MAMKIGGEYLSARITAKHFEHLAEEAGLARPFLKRRVPELAESILSKVPAVTTDNPVVMAVAKLIQGNCDRTIKKFKVEGRFGETRRREQVLRLRVSDMLACNGKHRGFDHCRQRRAVGRQLAQFKFTVLHAVFCVDRFLDRIGSRLDGRGRSAVDVST